MELPLLILAALYLLILIGIIIVGSLNVYTALKYGMGTPPTVVMSIAYIFGTIIIILATVVIVSGADWSSSISIGVPAVTLPNVTQ